MHVDNGVITIHLCYSPRAIDVMPPLDCQFFYVQPAFIDFVYTLWNLVFACLISIYISVVMVHKL